MSHLTGLRLWAVGHSSVALVRLFEIWHHSDWSYLVPSDVFQFVCTHFWRNYFELNLTHLFSIGHHYQMAMRFCWDSQKPLNPWDQWNPWSREIPWITLISHPLKSCIDELLESTRTELDDTYFTLDYLVQIRRRYSIEMLHDKLFEVLNSFQQRRRLEIPSLVNPSVAGPGGQSQRQSGGFYSPVEHPQASNPYQSQISSNIVELYHPDNNVTIVHYAPIICENYFNLPAAIFNRTRLGYYRLRLF